MVGKTDIPYTVPSSAEAYKDTNMALTRIAIVFPGQGSQSVGMLGELAQQYPLILETFAQASEVLGEDLWAICQDEDRLNQTAYTQPALLSASTALWRLLCHHVPAMGFSPLHLSAVNAVNNRTVIQHDASQHDINSLSPDDANSPNYLSTHSQRPSQIAVTPLSNTSSVFPPTSYEASPYRITGMAGHSLGEYSALVAADALEFADAIALVHARGRAMQNAGSMVVEAGAGQNSAVDSSAHLNSYYGQMAAVIGMSAAEVDTLCQEVIACHNYALVSAANYNSPKQTVIAGNRIGIEAFTELASTCKAKIVPLSVSVASHCALMRPAVAVMTPLLAKIHWRMPQVPVWQNLDARPANDISSMLDALSQQLVMPVRWTQTMDNLADAGVDMFIECGAGRVLTNLAKRQQHTLPCYPMDTPASFAALLEKLS